MLREEFNERVKSEVEERLQERDSSLTGELQEVEKNNGVKYTGIVFKGECNIQPMIYLDEFWKKYEAGEMEVSDVVDSVCNIYQRSAIIQPFNVTDLTNYEKVKERLTVVLRNAESNEEMLAKVPHEVHHDLAEMYRIDVDTIDGASGSVLIHNDLMDKLGVDQQTLHDDAWECMKANHPVKISPMLDVLMESAINEMGEEFAKEMLEIMGVTNPPMYIISNEDKTNGAVYMMDKDVLEKVAEKCDDSFTILPSSIHECIVIPDREGGDYETLKAMVEEVNSTQVGPEEVLSGNVYHYDMDTQELSMFDGESQSMGLKM